MNATILHVRMVRSEVQWNRKTLGIKGSIISMSICDITSSSKSFFFKNFRSSQYICTLISVSLQLPPQTLGHFSWALITFPTSFHRNRAKHRRLCGPLIKFSQQKNCKNDATKWKRDFSCFYRSRMTLISIPIPTFCSCFILRLQSVSEHARLNFFRIGPSANDGTLNS